MARTTFHPLRVAEVERLCGDAVAVSFEVPAELIESYAFLPGQSLTLRRRTDGSDERRSYSICAPMGERPRIGVRKIPGGTVSSWLTEQVAPGDVVEVLPPTGSFTPDLQRSGRHVLVAAGSGITPVLSIAGSLLRETDAHVRLMYGNRRSDTVMFADELADLKDAHPTRFEIVHVLSREPRESDLTTGRIDADKLRTLVRTLALVEHDEQWWLCGPYGMVMEIQQVLSELGVPEQRVHTELFYVEDVPPEPAEHVEPDVDGPSATVTVVLDGRSTTQELPRNVPVLDAAQQVRPDLPFACKGGVCGTCRAKVTSGEVRMRRNFALERAELDQGFVLTCQSLPTTDEVTLDYDA